MLTAKECLQSAEVCLALAHKSMVRDLSPVHSERAAR